MIEELRKRIECVDHRIMELITERNDIAAEIGSYKRRNGLSITDVHAESKVVRRYREYAEEHSIDADTAEGICRLLILMSKERQSG